MKKQIVFQYKDKAGKSVIQTKLLNKNEKGQYKWDLIELDVSGSFDKEHHVLRMTTYEAELIALGLLNAVVIRKNKINKKRIKSKR